jgi:amino acid permease
MDKINKIISAIAAAIVAFCGVAAYRFIKKAKKNEIELNKCETKNEVENAKKENSELSTGELVDKNNARFGSN